MPDWVQAGYTEYAKRLPHECRLTLHEIPAGKRAKGADLVRLTRDEGTRQLAAVPPGSRIVALDRNGRDLDTQALATRIEKQLGAGQDLALLVGGPEGLAPECLAAAHNNQRTLLRTADQAWVRWPLRHAAAPPKRRARPWPVGCAFQCPDRPWRTTDWRLRSHRAVIYAWLVWDKTTHSAG